MIMNLERGPSLIEKLHAGVSSAGMDKMQT